MTVLELFTELVKQIEAGNKDKKIVLMTREGDICTMASRDVEIFENAAGGISIQAGLKPRQEAKDKDGD